MRIYYPALLEDVQVGELCKGPCHGVTDRLRQLMPDAETEDLEYLAFEAAAAFALQRAAARPSALPLRAVIAADIEPGHVHEDPVPDVDPQCSEPQWAASAVELTAAVPWSQVVSIHIDEPDTIEVVRAAASGDEAALTQVLEADLLWYDISERADLIGVAEELAGPDHG